ncbi:uncharacterized protein LOC122025713 [Zingiber officinale]|uniref:uncharacterized protein LOC122025713 n=1 Tax=Zingiber officinale TaxID=94328 RepID=UPI001C4C0923|nr:uncharacterized protein LOC122025713 [Zingiber officinale]
MLCEGDGADRGPAMAPLRAATAAEAVREEVRWRHFDNSVNAISFGFVATAVLISMFLVMAIFERFLRSRSPLAEDGRGGGGDADFWEADGVVAGSGGACQQDGALVPSPKISMYSKEVSVLMPGHSTPTFIAYPAPAPCPPSHEHC